MTYCVFCYREFISEWDECPCRYAPELTDQGLINNGIIPAPREEPIND